MAASPCLAPTEHQYIRDRKAIVRGIEGWTAVWLPLRTVGRRILRCAKEGKGRAGRVTYEKKPGILGRDARRKALATKLFGDDLERIEENMLRQPSPVCPSVGLPVSSGDSTARGSGPPDANVLFGPVPEAEQLFLLHRRGIPGFKPVGRHGHCWPPDWIVTARRAMIFRRRDGPRFGDWRTRPSRKARVHTNTPIVFKSISRNENAARAVLRACCALSTNPKGDVGRRVCLNYGWRIRSLSARKCVCARSGTPTAFTRQPLVGCVGQNAGCCGSMQGSSTSRTLRNTS